MSNVSVRAWLTIGVQPHLSCRSMSSHVERGTPAPSPSGQANRKASLFEVWVEKPIRSECPAVMGGIPGATFPAP
jgi:hypothetical protein